MVLAVVPTVALAVLPTVALAVVLTVALAVVFTVALAVVHAVVPTTVWVGNGQGQASAEQHSQADQGEFHGDWLD